MVVCVQGRLQKVIVVVLYGFRDCPSLELPPISFPHLETVKIAEAEALQKPCTVGRGKSYGLKHQLFKSLGGWQWWTNVSLLFFVIAVHRRGSCEKRRLQKSMVWATSGFVSEYSQQMQRAACKPPQNKHLLEHLSQHRKGSWKPFSSKTSI